MRKLDYLKRALQANLPNNLAWIISCFCITREAVDAYKEHPYTYRLIATHTQYQFVKPDGSIETIDDSDTREPLFAFKTKVNVDPTWAANLQGATECTIGNLVFNSVAILPCFYKKFPFENGKLNIGNIEKYIAARMVDTPKENAERDADKIYVDEYLKFRDALVYLEQLAPIVSWSATRKGITAPEGIDEYRKELQLEYGSRLTDPTVFAEYEGKLKEFDRNWLKDDPAFGTFQKGKVLDISRKKMFLAIGIPDRLDIKEPIVPITRTLEQGQPTDHIQLTASLNGARSGSYSRGSETTNGGVVSKSVIRIGSNFRIDMDDCGTVFGIHKTYNKDIINTLVGRNIITTTGLVFVEKTEQANNYLDKPIIVRSPAYCQAGPGDRLCRTCAGAALSQHEEGLVIPLTEVSHLILNQSLKSMHGKVLSTAEVDLNSVLT